MKKVLSIGRDKNADIFNKDSAVAKRNIEYGRKLEEVHVVVFALKKSGLKSFKLSDNVTVYPTNSISKWFYVLDAVRLGQKIIKDNDFSPQNSVVTTQDPFDCGLVGWVVSSKFNIPLHLQIHTDFLSSYFKNSFFQTVRVMWAKFILPKANGVRVVSKRIADSILNAGIKLKTKPQILPIRIDLDSINVSKTENYMRENFPQFSFVIFMASRLTEEKRIEDALLVLKKIVLEYPTVGLVIAGTGPKFRVLANETKKLGISNNVVFLGQRNDIPDLMKSAQCFLSTSEFEGYGMSIIEAGLSRVPVVTTDVGVANEILKDGLNSFVCRVGDVSCLSSKIIDFINDSALRATISGRLESDVRGIIPSKEKYISDYVDGLNNIK
jgi:glycosyltransferase involved in cell wall biosynthesis